MVDSNIVVGFDLQGDFPKLFWEYKPKDMDLNTYVRVIVESFIVDKEVAKNKTKNIVEERI